LDFYGHQPSSNRFIYIEEFPRIAAPPRPISATCRYLPFTVSARKPSDLNFHLTCFARFVSEPFAVGRYLAMTFIKLRWNEWHRLRGRAQSREVRGRGIGEMFIVHCSIANCHRRWRFACSFIKDAAPKAPPTMTIGN